MSKPTTAWAHLPNAALIDWVLADAKKRPEVWAAARSAARSAARDAARGAARSAAWSAAWDAAWDAAGAVAGAVAWGAARDAICALVAWDDCAPLLDAPVDAVRLMAAAGHHPAVLLLPAVIVRNTP
jgi:hypothetical protein